MRKIIRRRHWTYLTALIVVKLPGKNLFKNLIWGESQQFVKVFLLDFPGDVFSCPGVL